jgi:hypothetical protein
MGTKVGVRVMGPESTPEDTDIEPDAPEPVAPGTGTAVARQFPVPEAEPPET